MCGLSRFKLGTNKIRVLEGVLAATEKRLNDYIAEDKARAAESGAQAK